jgi:hypothetical protein
LNMRPTSGTPCFECIERKNNTKALARS